MRLKKHEERIVKLCREIIDLEIKEKRNNYSMSHKNSNWHLIQCKKGAMSTLMSMEIKFGVKDSGGVKPIIAVIGQKKQFKEFRSGVLEEGDDVGTSDRFDTEDHTYKRVWEIMDAYNGSFNDIVHLYTEVKPKEKVVKIVESIVGEHVKN